MLRGLSLLIVLFVISAYGFAGIALLLTGLVLNQIRYRYKYGYWQ